MIGLSDPRVWGAWAWAWLPPVATLEEQWKVRRDTGVYSDLSLEPDWVSLFYFLVRDELIQERHKKIK